MLDQIYGFGVIMTREANSGDQERIYIQYSIFLHSVQQYYFHITTQDLLILIHRFGFNIIDIVWRQKNIANIRAELE